MTAPGDVAARPGPDRPRPPTGPGRVLVAVYGVLALAATARSAVQIVRDLDEAPLAYLLSGARRRRLRGGDGRPRPGLGRLAPGRLGSR